mmetsp:Transcript_17664/g.55294  ORF Transcript_17664/g.55294 Transcript_17664/m.55294 type:complete len:468 (+) Transcript_17664:279-1682(+)
MALNSPVFHPAGTEVTSVDRSLCGLPMTVLQDYLMDPFANEELGDERLVTDELIYESAAGSGLLGDEGLDGLDASFLSEPPPKKELPASVLAAVVKTEGISHEGHGEPGSMIKKVFEPPPVEEVAPPLLGSVKAPEVAHKRAKLEAGKAPAPAPVSEAATEKAAAPAPAAPGQRHKTQAQIDRRRDRNRILARRTRLRKKFFFESLQQQVAELERENAMLKEIMRTHPALASEARAISAQCSSQRASSSALLTESRARATELLTPTDFALMRLLQSAQRSFCITDPSLEDNPIVYASQSFLSQTGYALDQVVGRNCRFLQGPLTDRATVDRLRRAVSRGDDVAVTLLNYKADGTTFWNQLFIASLRDINERVVNFVGVQTQVPGPSPPPDAHASGGGIQHPAEQLQNKLAGKFPPSKVLVPASPFADRIGGPADPAPQPTFATGVPSDHPAASLLASPVFNQSKPSA